MAIQTINLGSYANDGTGDDLRTAFIKVNENFAELGGAVNISNGANVGAGTGIFAQRNLVNLEFKTLTSTDGSVTLTNTATTVNLKSNPKIQNDTAPVLGGNLNLNDHYIYGGDSHTTVWGYDITILAGLVQAIVNSNKSLRIDMGTFASPAAGNIDMNGININNGFQYGQTAINLDFGSII